MAKINQMADRHSTTLGDSAVDGLLNGGLSGFAMALYLVVAGLFYGESPGMILAYFDPRPEAQPMTGLLIHVAVSGVYGVLFALGYQVIARRVLPIAPGWLAGLLGAIYGLALFLVAQTFIMPDGGTALRNIPSIHFILAHLTYGISLGILVNRGNR